MSLFGVAVQLLMVVLLFNQEVVGYVLDKRSAEPEKSADDFLDYQLGVKYDEYPVSIEESYERISQFFCIDSD